MTQISNYPISQQVYERCWEVFTKTLINIKNPNDASQIMTGLLTPTERIMLVKRLSIGFLLIQGYQYRQISKVLRVSFPTITLVNMSLKYGEKGYREALARILNDEKFEEYFNQVIQKLVSLPAKATKGGGAWRYLKQELEKSSKQRKPF